MILKVSRPIDYHEFVNWSKDRNPSYESKIIHAEDVLGEYGLDVARKLFEASQDYKNFSYVSYYDLIRQACGIINKNAEVEFLNTPIEFQHSLLVAYRKTTCFETYIKLLKMSAYPENLKICYKTVDRNTFQEIPKNKVVTTFEYNGHPSYEEKMAKMASSFNDNPHLRNIGDEATLYLLVNIYGYELVFEVFERMKKELSGRQQKISILFSLLRDWKNIQAFPFSWILELSDNNNTASYGV